MNTNRLGRLVVVVAILGGMSGVRAAPLGTGFTYQGQLKQDGAPGNGNFNMEFRLFDAATLGNQIGSPVTLIAVPVSNGLFTVTLNATGEFGPSAFNGEARWLAIAVGGTPLTPRQRIPAAPYAVHALNSFWRASGSAITNTNGGFVGINRSTTVTGAEYFGIQAPVASGYGGMYIRTDGASALPFYGYSTGTQVAWTYLDGATGDWRLNVDGERLTVTDDGHVGIGTNAPAAMLQVEGPGNWRWDVGSTGRGDFYVGNGTYGLSIGVSYAGGGTGDTRIWAKGGTQRLMIGDPTNGDALTVASGNVGIGTNAPARLLQIGDNSTANSEGMIRLASRSGTQGSNRVWDIGVPETDADSSGIGYSFVVDDTQLGSGPEVL